MKYPSVPALIRAFLLLGPLTLVGAKPTPEENDLTEIDDPSSDSYDIISEPKVKRSRKSKLQQQRGRSIPHGRDAFNFNMDSNGDGSGGHQKKKHRKHQFAESGSFEDPSGRGEGSAGSGAYFGSDGASSSEFYTSPVPSSGYNAEQSSSSSSSSSYSSSSSSSASQFYGSNFEQSRPQQSVAQFDADASQELSAEDSDSSSSEFDAEGILRPVTNHHLTAIQGDATNALISQNSAYQAASFSNQASKSSISSLVQVAASGSANFANRLSNGNGGDDGSGGSSSMELSGEVDGSDSDSQEYGADGQLHNRPGHLSASNYLQPPKIADSAEEGSPANMYGSTFFTPDPVQKAYPTTGQSDTFIPYSGSSAEEHDSPSNDPSSPGVFGNLVGEKTEAGHIILDVPERGSGPVQVKDNVMFVNDNAGEPIVAVALPPPPPEGDEQAMLNVQSFANTPLFDTKGRPLVAEPVVKDGTGDERPIPVTTKDLMGSTDGIIEHGGKKFLFIGALLEV